MSQVYTETVLLTKADEELVLTTRSKERKAKLPPFTMIGRSGKMRGKLEGYPLLDVMADMSKAEAWFFKLVRRNMNINTNIAHIQNNLLSKSDQQKKKLAYKSLKSKDLVRRVQREMYMVNPDAMILPAAYEENKKVWEAL